MPRPPGIRCPYFVEAAESAMAECSIDLWHMRPDDREAILVAALDAELIGTPEQADAIIEAACHQRWREIKEERRQRQRWNRP